jgi:hypothetical protein
MSRTPPDPQPAPEAPASRQEARFASEFRVRLVWVDLSHACDARLKDISPGGARVVMSAPATAPRDVYLLAHLPGAAEPQRIVGQVRWQVGQAIGVRFEPELALETVRALAGAGGAD